MLEIKIEKAFKKDIEQAKKSGHYSDHDFELLKSVISALQNHQEIEPKFIRHSLTGGLQSFESMHVKNDWLLIFKIDDHYLNLFMLGKHTQVFKKFK